ncbi:MAG: glycosyl hydrolase family 57 [Candidatus Omnitrophica bacterium]|nr:glycosyl hydrolase family 57 [Candidatus Omnitrophota bacterium]
MSGNIKNFPDICGNERKSREINTEKNLYAPFSNIDFNKVRSAFGIALHMHQPTIPAGSGDLRTAPLISNLQHMMEHQNIGDNHNAPVFLWCYGRMSDFIRELVEGGKNPRVMLDYSGNLLWGLSQMREEDTLGKLRLIASDKKYRRYVEWLGTMWSHATVTSTPVPDIRLHIEAWREHFASIFGYGALERVRGFSPPEMHLPIHPDISYEYVKTLKECGYKWLMVQEHTIENPGGGPVRMPYLPHRLVAKNSVGEIQEITVLIKTQGSDTKLVAQMQPYYEAKTKDRVEYCSRSVPPFVLQISDGENGGVMMNEFPPAYKIAFAEIGKEGTVAMNGSEYLEFIFNMGIKENGFNPVQPVMQHRIWEFVDDCSPGACDRAITKAKEKYGGFNLERASWTNDKNWVKGYEHVLDPINKLSAMFHAKFDNAKINKTSNRAYREALLYLLLSQTSCFRYWGEGVWTDYAKEICRRGMETLA